MKKFLYILLFFLLLGLGVTFTIQNPQEVFVQYYLGMSWHGPLAVLLLLTLALGVILGAFFGFMRNLSLRRRYARNLKAQKGATNGHSNSGLVRNSRS